MGENDNLAWPFLELLNNTHSRARTLLEVSGKFGLKEKLVKCNISLTFHLIYCEV